MLAAVAYDNFDIAFDIAVPTVEKGSNSLVHLTSGTMVRLEHGVTTEDLKQSSYLWEQSRYNSDRSIAIEPSLKGFSSVYRAILDLFPSTIDEFKMTISQQFQAWQFRYDLINHGPDYFRQFRNSLGSPPTIEQIPICEMLQVPARAMNLNQSTLQGNLDAVEDLLAQGKLGDPTEASNTIVKDITDYVVVVHGDLATLEKVQSLMRTRSIEKTPWRRFQYVVFVMGLFHLKMACTNAIWIILIQPKSSHADATSVLQHVSILRPRETGKTVSNPGFRRMHEIIQHDGIALRLDCWRVAVQKDNNTSTSLNEYAETSPSWDTILTMSHRLVRGYVASANTISEERRKPVEKRDQQFENSLLKNYYFLLYEEITYAMNEGDIGRVERCFIPWIFIFKAAGKNKYAKQMTQSLYDLHYIYPQRLRHAVRMNWLCNPTGKPGKFRGVDWVVEQLNLYIKAWHGGSYSNHTVDRIIKESPLAEIYRKMHINIEDNFHLDNRTIKHSPPDLTKTIDRLLQHIKLSKPHERIDGRSSKYSIPDKLSIGIDMALTEAGEAALAPDEEEDSVIEAADLHDS